VLLIGLLLFGLLVGAAAQVVLPGRRAGVDWGLALAAGFIGSFVGGLLISLLVGDGLALKPSGLIGSFVGAVIVTLAWRWWASRRSQSAAPARRR